MCVMVHDFIRAGVELWVNWTVGSGSVKGWSSEKRRLNISAETALACCQMNKKAGSWFSVSTVAAKENLHFYGLCRGTSV